MEPLTGKQKRHLRALGQNLRPLCIVGKAGLTDKLAHNVSQLLDQHELIKVRIPAGPAEQRNGQADQLAQVADARCAGLVGRTVLLYRPNPQRDAAHRIVLP